MTDDGQEAEWVRRSVAGDTQAFGRLVERYQRRLLTAVTRSVARQSLAEDIVQEAFLRAFEAMPRFEGRSSFYTWLYRIAFNLVLSRRRRRAGPGNPTGPVPVEEVETSETTNPQTQAETKERRHRIQQAIGELDDTFRLPLVLREIEGMDYRQIGEVLRLPLGTVKSRIHRARTELREKLRDLL